VVDSATSFEFARQFIGYATRENNRILTDYADFDVGSLRRRLGARIRRGLTAGTLDPFEIDGKRTGAYVLAACLDGTLASRYAIDTKTVALVLDAYSRSNIRSDEKTINMEELCEGFDVARLKESIRITPETEWSPLMRALVGISVTCREANLPIRLAKAGEPGAVTFREYLAIRSPESSERIERFINEWDHAKDDLGRRPSLGDVTEYWNRGINEVREDLAEFQKVFPLEPDPSAVCDLLWSSTDDEFEDLMLRTVVEHAAPPAPPELASETDHHLEDAY
jgi:hypothetical protein